MLTSRKHGFLATKQCHTTFYILQMFFFLGGEIGCHIYYKTKDVSPVSVPDNLNTHYRMGSIIYLAFNVWKWVFDVIGDNNESAAFSTYWSRYFTSEGSHAQVFKIILR